jgi:dUTP pyrophosphatase
MRVKIKRLDKDLPLPEYKTKGAVAFDLVVRETTVIKSHEVGRIPSNIVVKIPEGYMLYIMDRSSTAMKKGLLITAGIIDQDYCGDKDELLTQFYNFTDTDVTIERGERIAQGVFVKIEIGEWNEVDSMDSSSRGGFGTTG